MSEENRKMSETMSLVTVESIRYRIISEAKAIIDSWREPIPTPLSRNRVAFNGIRISGAHLDSCAFSNKVEAILIPCSVRTISDFSVRRLKDVEYVVFEFGSQLQSISEHALSGSSFRSQFLPDAVSFSDEYAFYHLSSLACVHFGRQSSLTQLKSSVFDECRCISAIPIPASVKHIHNRAFKDCLWLRMVQFKLPSQCWLLSTGQLRNVICWSHSFSLLQSSSSSGTTGVMRAIISLSL
jgi:hypothetical protein